MPDISTTNLKNKAVNSFSFLILREIGIKIFSLLGQIFLARLLIPQDFGVFTIFSFIINFLSLLTTFGLNFSLIQKEKNITTEEIEISFYLQQFTAIVLVVLIFLFGNNLRFIYSNLSTLDLLYFKFFSLTLLITPFSTIITSILERKLSYKKVSIVEFSGVVVYEITAVILAFLKFGILSFIIGIVVKELYQDILIFSLEPFIPKFNLNIRKIKSLLGYGIFVEGQGTLTLLISSLNPIILGKFFNTYFVGIVDFASSIGYAPTAIADNIGRVTFAAFSRIQKQKKSLILASQISIGAISGIYFLILLIFLTSGKDLVNFIFTSKWQLSIISIDFFLIATFFYSLRTPLIQIILAMGKSKIYLWINILVFIIQLFFSIYLLKYFSYNSIAIAAAIGIFISFLMYLIILKYYGIGIKILSQIAPKFFIFVISLIFNFGLLFYAPNINFILKIAFDALFYIMLYLFFCLDELKFLINLLINR